MRRTAIWIMLGALMGAVFSLATLAGEAVLRTPAQSLLPTDDGPNCTALILDRDSGRTTAAPCGGSAALLHEAAAGNVQDKHARLPASRLRT